MVALTDFYLPTIYVFKNSKIKYTRQLGEKENLIRKRRIDACDQEAAFCCFNHNYEKIKNISDYSTFLYRIFLKRTGIPKIFINKNDIYFKHLINFLMALTHEVA